MQTGQVLPFVCEVRCTSMFCTRVCDCACLLMRLFYYIIFSIMIREVLGILNLDPSSPLLCAGRQVWLGLSFPFWKTSHSHIPNRAVVRLECEARSSSGHRAWHTVSRSGMCSYKVGSPYVSFNPGLGS